MAKRRKTRKAKASGAATKTACEKRGGRWVKFPGNRQVCFLHDKATSSTKRKRAASLRKARKASPIGKRGSRRSRKRGRRR